MYAYESKREILKFDIRLGITWGLIPGIPLLFDCVILLALYYSIIYYLERTPQYWDVPVSMVIASL